MSLAYLPVPYTIPLCVLRGYWNGLRYVDKLPVVETVWQFTGVPVETAVAPNVLEAAYDGRFQARQLYFGEPISDKVRVTAFVSLL